MLHQEGEYIIPVTMIFDNLAQSTKMFRRGRNLSDRKVSKNGTPFLSRGNSQWQS